MRSGALVLTVFAALLAGCDGTHLGSTGGPIRTATISVTASAKAQGCDGPFTGTGKVVAAYAGTGAPAAYHVSPRTSDFDNAVGTSTSNPVTISGPADPPRRFDGADGRITDVCKVASFKVRAPWTSDAKPPDAAGEAISPEVAIPPVDAKIKVGPDVTYPVPSNRQRFLISFSLECCPGAGNSKVTFRNLTNINGPLPPQTLVCPRAGPAAFTVSGTKQDAAMPGAFRMVVTPAAAGKGACSVGELFE